MTTTPSTSALVVLKFPTADGAQMMLGRLESLQKQQLITVNDGAIVTWKAGAKKPKTEQLRNMTGVGALGGAFWGMLFGLLFFVPFFGLAIGAAVGALMGPWPIARTFLYTAIAGGALAVAISLWRRQLTATLGRTASLVMSPATVAPLIEHSVTNNRFPYAPAVAVGALIVAIGL